MHDNVTFLCLQCGYLAYEFYAYHCQNYHVLSFRHLVGYCVSVEIKQTLEENNRHKYSVGHIGNRTLLSIYKLGYLTRSLQ